MGRTARLGVGIAALLATACGGGSSGGDGGGAPTPPDETPPGAPPPVAPQPPAPPAQLDAKVDNTSFDAIAVAPNGDLFVAGEIFGAGDFGAGTITPAADEIAFVAKYDATGKLAFVKTFHGTATTQQYSLAVDASGGVWMTALTSGAGLDFGGGKIGWDSGAAPDAGTVALVHFDATGKLLSSEYAVGCQNGCGDAFLSIAKDGTLAILGSSTGNADGGTTVLTDSGTFTFLWQRAAGGAAQLGGTGSGDRAVGAAWLDTAIHYSVFFGSTARIAQENTSGMNTATYDHDMVDAAAFATVPGAPYSSYLAGVWSDGQGIASVTLDSTDWVIPIQPTGADDLVMWHPATLASYDKGVVVAGDFSGALTIGLKSLNTGTAPSKDATDIFVAKITNAGMLTSFVKLGGPERESVHGVGILADGRVVVAGETGGRGWLTTTSF